MTPDPFYKRTGFWAALMATVPGVFAAFNGTMTSELAVAIVGAWGGFFTAKTARGPVGPVE